MNIFIIFAIHEDPEVISKRSTFHFQRFQGLHRQTNYIHYTPTTMPNRKDLKKSINSICSDIFAECVAMSLYHGNTDETNVDALLASIMAIRADFISRISHPEPGMKRKDYYDHLANAFTEQISEVIDQICNMSE